MKKIAVIGSGVMGAGIAAHIANAGTEVLLFDIATKDLDKSIISRTAIKKILLDPSPLTHYTNEKFITACNLEDDLIKLNEVDWVIEAIVEKLEVKQSLYSKLLAHCNKDTIISSNTSTIQLCDLTKNFDYDLESRFLITHFFNPPRQMRLLEIVASQELRPELLKKIEIYADISLGKQIVKCNDTPGFIANRIGCYWLEIGLREAIKLGINVNEADLIMSKFFGIPKTGIFGLFDLIGIDVMNLIAKSLLSSLPNNDDFSRNYSEVPLVNNMINNGYIGRKGKGGFYKINIENGEKKKEILDLATGNYKNEEKPNLSCFDATNIYDLISTNDKNSIYAWNVMSKTLTYAAKLIPSVTNNISDIDTAMKLGFNWKYGIFELIDQFANNEISGALWLTKKLESENKEIPNLFKEIGIQQFYKKDNNKDLFFNLASYSPILKNKDKLSLEDIKQNNKPIFQNKSSSIWDIGDEIACFELTSKMGALDQYIFESLENAYKNILKDYKGMIIYNNSNLFSAGANLKFILELAKDKKFSEIEGFIKFGQNIMLGVKNSAKPIISAVKNLALGGGCELIMHSASSQNYIEIQTGLVEVNVGLIPAWGGCKEMILRSSTAQDLADSFKNIMFANTSKSAIYARDMQILKNKNITMNIDRLLADAKNQILNFKEVNIYNKASFDITMLENIYNEVEAKLSPYSKIIVRKLIEVFSCKRDEYEIMKKELSVFMELIENTKTQERIEHMINTGKALKN
ncbi:MAG: 3-hydroxyacyl-CoA dehydrogenase NAD-binding domain-containing protein [Alphaproteobacteria bacterium]